MKIPFSAGFPYQISGGPGGEKGVNMTVPQHDQTEDHRYVIHYPPHPARESDPHYKDFNAYHRRTRRKARCYIGQRVGYQDCRDAQGNPCVIADDGSEMSGLELHHAHIEFALQQGVSLAALETDYPGISNPDEVGQWVESAQNFRWLCVFHHRTNAGGAHAVSHSDWEGSQYIRALTGPMKALAPKANPQ